MAGDHVNANVLAFFKDGVGNDPSNITPIQTQIANIFTNGVTGAATKGSHAGVTNNALLPGILEFLEMQPDNYTMNGAYLNWMLLDDEQFSLVKDGQNSGFVSLLESHGQIAGRQLI